MICDSAFAVADMPLRRAWLVSVALIAVGAAALTAVAVLHATQPDFWGIFAAVAVFVFFIAILLIRPEGLARAATTRRV